MWTKYKQHSDSCLINQQKIQRQEQSSLSSSSIVSCKKARHTHSSKNYIHCSLDTARLEVRWYETVCHTGLPWLAWNHATTSFLRNTISVCHRAKMDHSAYLIKFLPRRYQLSRERWFSSIECTRNRLLAGLCSNPLGKLTVHPRPSSWIWGTGLPGQEMDTNGMEGNRKEGKGEGEGEKERDKVPYRQSLLPDPVFVMHAWKCM